jgi:hypothetical protein
MLAELDGGPDGGGHQRLLHTVDLTMAAYDAQRVCEIVSPSARQRHSFQVRANEVQEKHHRSIFHVVNIKVSLRHALTFMECTAMSMRPSSSASSISFVKRPLPPMSASGCPST